MYDMGGVGVISVVVLTIRSATGFGLGFGTLMARQSRLLNPGDKTRPYL